MNKGQNPTVERSLVDEVIESWGWIGIDAFEIIAENDFGNLMIEDTERQFWRLCPEDCYCRVVASNREEFDSLSRDQDFLHDWYMRALVDLACDKLGPLPQGRKYCLKIPGFLGGEYGGDNLAIAPLIELVRLSGDIARQTHELPTGTGVKLRFVE